MPELRVDAGRGLRDDHSVADVGLPGQRVRVHRAEQQGLRAASGRRPIASARRRCVRAGFGIYYNPNQMNSFTFLTNNPPLAAVSTYTSDPANPTLSFEHPTGVAGSGGHAGHDFADAASAERPEGSVELRRAARAVARRGAQHRSTSAPTPATSIAASSTTRRRRARARSIRGGRRQCSAAAASSRTISSPTTTP